MTERSTGLPDPAKRGGKTLEKVLAARRSVREFHPTLLTDTEVSQLLWAAQGRTDSEGCRTVPSAGALYPLRLFLADSSGLYHYEPYKHALRQLGGTDLRRPLHRAALTQDAILVAPAVFIIAADQARMASKYGTRAKRYVYIEAGHAAQNLLLQAVSLDLGGVPIGAFEDDRVSKVLELPGDESPIYIIPVGHPR